MAKKQQKKDLNKECRIVLPWMNQKLYSIIKKDAGENQRTIGGQVTLILEKFYKKKLR